MGPFIIITVDGGAASGKSSTSKLLAKKLNLLHVDTGVHYRAITRYLLDKKITIDDPMAIHGALNELLFAVSAKVEGNEALLAFNQQVFPDEVLRSEEVNKNVSPFSSLKEIRSFLKEFQRSHADIAKKNGFNGLIMEGRDIGSVIFPAADFRFFLEASESDRKERRAKEGFSDSIEERDALDSSRENAPLKCPDGAIRINTSELSLLEVTQMMFDQIQTTAEV